MFASISYIIKLKAGLSKIHQKHCLILHERKRTLGVSIIALEEGGSWKCQFFNMENKEKWTLTSNIFLNSFKNENFFTVCVRNHLVGPPSRSGSHSIKDYECPAPRRGSYKGVLLNEQDLTVYSWITVMIL